MVMNKLIEVTTFKRRTKTTISHKPPVPSLLQITTRQRSKNAFLKQQQKQQQEKIEIDTLSMDEAELRNAVKLPKDEDLNDWLAVNVVDFSRNVSLISNVILNGCCCCNNTTCPVMKAGDNREYLWLDKSSNDTKYHTACSVSAPDYFSLLFEWINGQIENDQVFPVDESQQFPKNFHSIVKKIMSRLFRVFAHVYVHHYDDMIGFGSVAHLNTLFMHFMLFVWEFKLISKDELIPVNHVIIKLFGDRVKNKLSI